MLSDTASNAGVLWGGGPATLSGPPTALHPALPSAYAAPCGIGRCCAAHWQPEPAVVGTALTALNQGDAILLGQFSGALAWKIPLTYCVPFLVATYGALSNSRN